MVVIEVLFKVKAVGLAPDRAMVIVPVGWFPVLFMVTECGVCAL